MCHAMHCTIHCLSMNLNSYRIIAFWVGRRGYLGPGGIGDDGDHPDCTGYEYVCMYCICVYRTYVWWLAKVVVYPYYFMVILSSDSDLKFKKNCLSWLVMCCLFALFWLFYFRCVCVFATTEAFTNTWTYSCLPPTWSTITPPVCISTIARKYTKYMAWQRGYHCRKGPSFSYHVTVYPSTIITTSVPYIYSSMRPYTQSASTFPDCVLMRWLRLLY